MKKLIWSKILNNAQKVLIENNRPMHYRELYSFVCKDIYYNNKNTRPEENLRNYLDYNSKRFSHIGKGLFGLKIWYSKIPRIFLESQRTIIPRDNNIIRIAYHESIDREPFMLNKYNDIYSTRISKIGEGLSAEKHVINLYSKIYGNNIVLPCNDVKTYSEYDFGIKTPVRTFYFDVKSVNSNIANLYVETRRLDYNVDFFIKVSRQSDSFSIDGFADKNTLLKKAIQSKNQYVLSDKNLIKERTINLFLNHCILNIDCSKIVK